ncbi:MAG TPA: hypothetical protein VGI39_33480 [Polyangiaceae bacterium]|jgi:hypothetical protein
MNASHIVLLAIGSAAITVACGGEPTSSPGAAGAGTAAQSATPSPADKGDDDGEMDAGADAGNPMFACGSGVSCVAVGRVDNCCYNGWKIAVAEDQVEAYKNATACTGRRPICPMYIVRDTRVAACDTATRTCQMVQPGDTDTAQ